MKTTDVPANLREFIKVFNRVADYRWDSYTVFSDFVSYCIECFTVVKDTEFIDRLKKNYGKEYDVFPLMFRELVLTMERELNNVEWFDILGTLYEIIASSSKRSAFGQFFTPAAICDLMTHITGTEKVQGKRINDPSCGSGRTLLSFNSLNPGNYLYGEDLDPLCVRMCVVNFLLHGIKGQVCHKNSLSQEFFAAWQTDTLTCWKIEEEQTFSYHLMQQMRKPEPKPEPKQPEIVLPVAKQFPGTQLSIF